MKKFYFVSILLILNINLFSQDISRNKFFIEAGGSSLFYSVNYERLLGEYRDVNLPFRIGLSIMPGTSYYTHGPVSIPLSLGVIKNIKSNHFIEARLFVTTFLSRIIDGNDKAGDCRHQRRGHQQPPPSAQGD